MDPAWKTGDVQTQTWEGRAGPADYRLEVPALGSFPPFDRFWREQARRLIRGLRSMGGPWPVELHASFQETRRDDAALSGFWDISRRTGHAGWDLSRVAATFLPGSGSPQPLPVLFYPGRQRRLPPLVQREVLGLRQRGECLLFRDCGARCLRELDPWRYYLTGEGLAVFYPQEVLGPRSAGLPTVLIPFGRMEGQLRFPF